MQLWRIQLADAAASPGRYLNRLTPEEIDRTERLRAGQVRMQFVVGRACLRVLLGRDRGCSPELVPIQLGRYGKPEVPEVEGRKIFFNVAHSGETILIALCRKSPLGVDLEYLDRSLDVMEVAAASFAPAEYREISAIANPDQRRRAFFHCWTRKEAVVKADGRGLSLPFPSFEVPVTEQASSSPVRIAGTREEPASTYFVSDIELGGTFVGAFALAGPVTLVQTFDFPLGIV